MSGNDATCRKPGAYFIAMEGKIKGQPCGNTQLLIHVGIKAELGKGRFHNGTGLILNRCRHVGEHIVKPPEPSVTVQSRLNRVLDQIKSNKVL
ncbi:MAG: hypothetical protein ACOYMW_00435 [Candidatus Competibacteraceae bacterium]